VDGPDCGTVINREVSRSAAGSSRWALLCLSEQFVMEGERRSTPTSSTTRCVAVDMPPSEVVHVDTYEPEGPWAPKRQARPRIPTARPSRMRFYHATGYRCKTCHHTGEDLQGMKK